MDCGNVLTLFFLTINQIKTFHICINSLKFYIHTYSVKIIHCFMVGERCPEYTIALKFSQQGSFHYR